MGLCPMPHQEPEVLGFPTALLAVRAMGEGKKVIIFPRPRQRPEAEGTGNSVPCQGFGDGVPNVPPEKGTYVFSRSMAGL